MNQLRMQRATPLLQKSIQTRHLVSDDWAIRIFNRIQERDKGGFDLWFHGIHHNSLSLHHGQLEIFTPSFNAFMRRDDT